MSTKPLITTTFNIILFFYICLVILADYLFNPDMDTQVPWDAFYNVYPSMAIIFAVILIFVLIFGGALLLKYFWNRFLSDILKVRNISFQESLSLILILSLLMI